MCVRVERSRSFSRHPTKHPAGRRTWRVSAMSQLRTSTSISCGLPEDGHSERRFRVNLRHLRHLVQQTGASTIRLNPQDRLAVCCKSNRSGRSRQRRRERVIHSRTAANIRPLLHGTRLRTARSGPPRRISKGATFEPPIPSLERFLLEVRRRLGEGAYFARAFTELAASRGPPAELMLVST